MRYFILFALIPVIIISIVSVQISSGYITDQAITSSEQIVLQVKGELNTVFSSMKDISSLVAVDPFFQQKIRETYYTDKDLYKDKLDGDAKLFSINMYMDNINGIYVMGENGIKYKSNYYNFLYDTLGQYTAYFDIIDNGQTLWFSPIEGSYFVKTTGDPVVTMGAPLVDISTGLAKGVVVVEIKELVLQNIIGARLGKTGYIYIVDENNDIIVSPNGVDVSEMHDQVKAEIEKEKSGRLHHITDSALIIETEMDAQGWKIIGVMPNKELYTGSKTVYLVIIITSAAALIIAALTAFYVSKRTVKPIKKIGALMKEVESGNFDVNIDIASQDEIGKLSVSFNKMTKQIDALMKRVSEDGRKLRKAEFKALQAQINPHFLYNTMDTIVWLAREKKNDLVIKMVISLTRFFKIGISSGSDLITVGEEIAHVENYLIIQSVRYKEKLDYSINLPEETADYYTLKLVLQPLVENAIYHGIKLKEGKGHITIDVFEEDDNIVFEVTDDGIGMDEKRLASLQNAESGIRSGSYGVRNIIERIKIFFGQQYGVDFYSEPGKGTQAVVTIPKIKKPERFT